jgi:hypothetical protein
MMKYLTTSTLAAIVIGILIIPILALGTTAQTASAFSRLQTGTWTIHANGYDGKLVITSVSGGVVKGTVTFDGEPTQKIIGAYDANLQKIWFIRLMKPNDPSGNQFYTGYLFKESSFGSSGTADVMTGYFEHLNGIKYYGWYATK